MDSGVQFSQEQGPATHNQAMCMRGVPNVEFKQLEVYFGPWYHVLMLHML